MVGINGNGTVVAPFGGQPDSVAESQRRRRPDPGLPGFRTTDGEADAPVRNQPPAVRTDGPRLVDLLRRRTDRGEGADPAIEIPPHLERRRAWREAFGLNTWHTQQIAQDDTDAGSGDARAAAISAYRGMARRGRLDLDLAQQFSVTV